MVEQETHTHCVLYLLLLKTSVDYESEFTRIDRNGIYSTSIAVDYVVPILLKVTSLICFTLFFSFFFCSSFYRSFVCSQRYTDLFTFQIILKIRDRNVSICNKIYGHLIKYVLCSSHNNEHNCLFSLIQIQLASKNGFGTQCKNNNTTQKRMSKKFVVPFKRSIIFFLLFSAISLVRLGNYLCI